MPGDELSGRVYLAPEAAGVHTPDRMAADLFSLGALAYYVLTGGQAPATDRSSLLDRLERDWRGPKAALLVDRFTFSAAIVCACLIPHRLSRPVQVFGEPMGDWLAFWAEGDRLHLPDSGAILRRGADRGHVHDGQLRGHEARRDRRPVLGVLRRQVLRRAVLGPGAVVHSRVSGTSGVPDMAASPSCTATSAPGRRVCTPSITTGSPG